MNDLFPFSGGVSDATVFHDEPAVSHCRKHHPHKRFRSLPSDHVVTVDQIMHISKGTIDGVEAIDRCRLVSLEFGGAYYSLFCLWLLPESGLTVKFHRYDLLRIFRSVKP